MANEKGRKSAKKAAGSVKKSGNAQRAKKPTKSAARAGGSAALKSAGAGKKSGSGKANRKPPAKVAAKSSVRGAAKPVLKGGGLSKDKKAAKGAGTGKAVTGTKKAATKNKSASAAKKSSKSTKKPGSAAKKAGSAGTSSAPARKSRVAPRKADDESIDLLSKLQELKDELEELGGEFLSDGDSDEPDGLDVAFLESVLEVESAGWTRPYDLLLESGISLPKPQELGNAELAAKLWEVINALALVNVFLDRTDHLSDRELYTHLWTESLREEMIIIPHNPGFQSHIDVIGSGSEEDTTTWLRYYADDEDRRDWAEQFPDFIMPEREQPLYDRDRTLPHSGGEQTPGVH